MTLDLISFVLGAALLVIGLIGGGIQAKEITIPAIGTSIRVGASIFGISFIILGLWLGNRFEQPDINPENTVQPSTPTSASEKILFIARDQLGANQKKEKITLFINGAQAGEFKIDSTHPAASTSIKVPAEGDYPYALSGYVDEIDNEDEEVKRYSIVGQGTILITKGAIFEFKVKGSSGSTIELELTPLIARPLRASSLRDI
ncbi:hypothetical protein D3C80_913070 [compost metagenome]